MIVDLWSCPLRVIPFFDKGWSSVMKLASLFKFLGFLLISITLCFIFQTIFATPQMEKIDTSVDFDWLQIESQNVNKSLYKDSSGEFWLRLDTISDNKNPPSYPPVRIKLRAECFPKGCELAWYTKMRVPLFKIDNDTDSILRYKPGSVPRAQIFVYKVSPKTLNQGCVFELPFATRAESLFLKARNVAVESDLVGIDQGFNWKSYFSSDWDGRLYLSFIMSVFLCAFLYLVRYYCVSNKVLVGLTAIAFSFLLATIWFDSTIFARHLIVDKGDDSYYLAYAQNMIRYGNFFVEPTKLLFGRGLVPNNHGMPGVSILLSPFSVIHAFFNNTIGQNFILMDIDIYFMRGLSAIYALGAMLFLFLTFHRAKPGFWSVIVPTILLWGTSLSRWTFVRSIFTHSPEMFLLCFSIWLATSKSNKFVTIRLIFLSFVLGFLVLLRGEYLVTSFFLLFLCRIPSSTTLSRSQVIIIRAVQLCIVSISVCVYYSWVNSVPTGYGTIASAELPTQGGVWSVLGRFIENAGILFKDYFVSGGLLILSMISGILVFCFRKKIFIKDSRQDEDSFDNFILPIRFKILVISALVMFILNCAFTPPLGLEFQHRYSLKLYPLALLWLWSLLNIFPKHPNKYIISISKYIFIVLIFIGVLVNFICTVNPKAPAWQNYTFLTNIQMQILPPHGYELTNLFIAAICASTFLIITLISHFLSLIKKKN